MASRLRGYEISRPQPILQVQIQPAAQLTAQKNPPHDTTIPAQPAPWPSGTTRPLSDIRELTEPSLIDAVASRASAGRVQHKRSTSRGSSARRNGCVRRNESTKSKSSGAHVFHAVSKPFETTSSSSYSTTPEQSSYYAIPPSSVPRRSSSHTHARAQPAGHSREAQSGNVLPLNTPQHVGGSIPNRGYSQSPVKEAGLRLDPLTADAARRLPSRTHIRNPHPYDMLEFPEYKHPRVKLELQASAPLFVGGGTVEGFVRVSVDDNERIKQRRSLGIGAISVDLIGFEEVHGNRRAIFTALGIELVDAEHPPPPTMVEPANPLEPNEPFWTLSPSTSALPFVISLPLNTGPPPFESKQACIRFTLSTTALIRDAGKHYRVRTSQEVYVLPTYDPEKALTSLPSPLTASDELQLPRSGGHESIKVTAGLHRQVWVSGSSIFVDVHIANKSCKAIRKLHLSLECNVLCYKHAAAATREKSAGQARIFESNHQTILSASSLKAGVNAWSGVEPHTSQTRTCDLELPRGHATVRCGKYFEVRYFVNVTVSVSSTKQVSVQLPIILIHMNSLDAVPNSVAQVAAAIEEKRADHRRRSCESRPATRVPSRQRSTSSPARTQDLHRRPSYTQGRAFAAPRQQSLERQREERANLDELRHAVDSSPRKYQPQLQGFALKKMGSNISAGNFSLGGAVSTPGETTFQVMAYRTPERKRTDQTSTSRHSEDGPSERLRDGLRRMGSLESFYTKKPIPVARSTVDLREQNRKPSITHSTSRHVLAPHTLGLSTTVDVPGYSSTRPGTSTSFREKMDRSRFEFKAVRRKASGNLVERGRTWWDHVRHKDREREGWI